MRHLITALLIAASTIATAQNSGNPDTLAVHRHAVPSFLKDGRQMPDAYYFLPPPPKQGDPVYVSDSLQYLRLRELRTTLRGDTAVQDAQLSVAYFMKRFSPAVGRDLTPERYPVLADCMNTMMQSIRASVQKAKDSFARQRPYNKFQEHTPIPEHEGPNDDTSYPSGHSVRAWALGMFLSAVFPDHANGIMHIAYELGQSRAILGFHYQSDIDAARLAASVGYAFLSGEDEFQDAIEHCREEVGEQ